MARATGKPKLPSEQQKHHDLDVLLKTCRPSESGPALIARLTRPLVRLSKRIGEESVAILVADASPAHYMLVCDHMFMLAEYLRVDTVQVQPSIADPLIAQAVRLGGVIVGFRRGKRKSILQGWLTAWTRSASPRRRTRPWKPS